MELTCCICWCSCSVVRPRDLIPRLRHAACNSDTDIEATPSAAIIWGETERVQSPLSLSSSGDCNLPPTAPRRPAPPLTSSSDLMVRSCIISWKRSRLLVPMGCSSSSLHRATSWGRSRCSSVSSSSNSLENRTMSLVVGCSPVPRT
ncbi:hypothetical protein EYF80_022921 [Liparis tanakae]|uniref:Uncharacterized protein n=1 Tax=Liparis tanakae TaxID=230148 RepID=A0A4Z2HQ04_9TELE|nr:hypothetical protein EYF80_022921 [Liparis tanakae]